MSAETVIDYIAGTAIDDLAHSAEAVAVGFEVVGVAIA